MTAAGDFINFAYGSNMSSARLRARAPSARVLGVARLDRYRLMWHKAGQDGSAKCDIVETGDAQDTVWGVLYAMTANDKVRVDAAEGLGRGYELKALRVVAQGGPVSAWAYCATAVVSGLRPFDWYQRYVLAGAIEHGLPPAYCRAIAAVACTDDPDRTRAAEHRQAQARVATDDDP